MTQLANVLPVTPTEMIEEALGPHYPMPTAVALAYSKAVGEGSGNNVQIPRWLRTTAPTGTKVESDEFTIVEASMDQENISGGWVGYRDRVSYESNKHSLADVVRGVIALGIRSIADRADVDGLAELANATNDEDNTGVALTDDHVLDALALYDTLDVNETSAGRATVITPGMHRSWIGDLKTNGGEHLAGDRESERIVQLFGARQGFVGMRHGVQIFKSNNVSLTVADANAAIFPIGEGGALAYRVWETIGFSSTWEDTRKAWDVVIAANYGWGLSDPENLVGLINLAAAA
jgi:hypothetical protein